MKVDYPPFGGHKTKQHFKCYNSQVILAKSKNMLWFKLEVRRLIILAQYLKNCLNEKI